MIEPMTADDATTVAAQLQRPARGVVGVAHRCRCGKPDVVATQPRLPDGTPFPTTYYLTCPHLVAAVSRLEAAGGVERWSEAVGRDPELAADLERATEEQRELRKALAAGRTGRDEGASLELGIGGSANPGRLKCLHAHAAFALANPGYLLGEGVLAEVEPLWPSQHCCSEP